MRNSQMSPEFICTVPNQVIRAVTSRSGPVGRNVWHVQTHNSCDKVLIALAKPSLAVGMAGLVILQFDRDKCTRRQ